MKEYDVHGKPVGKARRKLAGLLSAELTAMLGQQIEVRARDIFSCDNRWTTEKWYATFWFTAPWGGTRKMVYGLGTMSACAKRGITITARDPEPPNDMTTFYEVRADDAAQAPS